MTVTSRFDMRKEPDGTWTVYDIFTGAPAEIDGVKIMRLDIEEADDAIDLLNRIDDERRQTQDE